MKFKKIPPKCVHPFHTPFSYFIPWFYRSKRKLLILSPIFHFHQKIIAHITHKETWSFSISGLMRIQHEIFFPILIGRMINCEWVQYRLECLFVQQFRINCCRLLQGILVGGDRTLEINFLCHREHLARVTFAYRITEP